MDGLLASDTDALQLDLHLARPHSTSLRPSLTAPCYPCDPWLRFLCLCFISPSRSFSIPLRSEAGSERHPTWGRFSFLATRECARQPLVRANRGQDQSCVGVIRGKLISALTRRRFFRSADRYEAGPMTDRGG